MSVVGTAFWYGQNTANLINTQTQISKATQQVSTGEKTNNYGDLGAQALSSISLADQKQTIDNYSSTITLLQMRASMVNQSLSSIASTATTIRDDALTGINKATDFASIRSEAAGALQQVFSALGANIAGRLLFSGQTLGTAPVVDPTTLGTIVASAVTTATSSSTSTSFATDLLNAVDTTLATSGTYYTGGASSTAVNIGDSQTVTMDITANDPAILKVISGLYALANIPNPSPDPVTPPAIDQATQTATIQAVVQRLTDSIGGVNDLVTKNGETQAVLNTAATQNGQASTILEQQFSNINSADLTATSSTLTQLQNQLQASYKVTAAVKDLSLVNYL
ncbi:MAG TPA: flagellin [Stellaceae bacterium]|nr:flagellin [Stellaceae bacterium]